MADTPSQRGNYSCTPSRRRSSSVPDITHDLPPTKKRRVVAPQLLFTCEAEEGTKVHDQKGLQFYRPNIEGARPSHDSTGDAEFRQQVLNQLAERIRLKVAKLGSWAEMNDRAMFQLVSAASQPNLDGNDEEVDAYFLTGEEAAAQVECTKQQQGIPIITCDQQQFKWRRDDGRPIEQFFRRIEGLDKTVSVQIPSLRMRG